MNVILFILVILINIIFRPVSFSFLILDNVFSKNLSSTVAGEDNYIIANSLFQLPLAQEVFLRSRYDIMPPIRNWSVKDLEINAKAALAIFVSKDSDYDKVLYQKNIFNKMPIASLTKIMTAVVIMENANLNDITKISKEAVLTEGSNGGLRVDEEISVNSLLRAMLISSSNDAAVALAEYFRNRFGKDIVEAMNEKANELKMTETNFSTPSGLNDIDNYSTVRDLYKLVKYALRFDKIWEITRIPAIDIYSTDGRIPHHLVNTNKLLGKIDGIYGGKTGYTEGAKESMVLIRSINNGDGTDLNYIIFILLGSDNRIMDMYNFVKWVEEAYIFKI